MTPPGARAANASPAGLGALEGAVAEVTRPIAAAALVDAADVIEAPLVNERELPGCADLAAAAEAAAAAKCPSPAAAAFEGTRMSPCQTIAGST